MMQNGTNLMIWTYRGKEFTSEEIESYQGFVYLITNLENGKKYIGKKFFVKPKILPKTKSRKRRVRTTVESDWKAYFGSSEALLNDIAEWDDERKNAGISREILRLCKTKGECSYYEIKEQLAVDALLDENYYNSFVGCKIHRRHVING
jgi:hypothetical protein